MRTASDDTDEHVAARSSPAASDGELVLGRYRLLRRLGAGGFGVVWLAHDERLERAVAVKRIPVGDGAVGPRAEREAKAAARLAHPGIVALYESGRDADAVYLVSELVRGRTLADLIANGALSDRDVLRIGVGLCDALAHAHGRGIVHRDVKPGNVIVPDRRQDGAGPAKLTDFGVARIVGDEVLTRTGDVVGTLAYMAPEQAEGRASGPEADLYALALVLYEALAGVNPVRGRGAASTARRLGARLPPLGRLRRDLPLDLCAAIDRAVRPRPEQRGSVGELRAALAAGVARAGDDAGPVDASALETLAAARPRTRVPLVVRAPAGLAAGALAVAAVAWLGPPPPVPAPAAGAAAALAVALLPRLGWLAAAAAIVAWLAAAGALRTAAVVGAAAVPTVVLLRRAGPLWSAPALAVACAVPGLAGAWPALAGQVTGAWRRAALGALGGWWLALAEALAGERLALGPPPGTAATTEWATTVAEAWHDVLVPVATSGAPALAGVWAVAALILPWLVRGRLFAVDLVAATAWAAGLGSATQAVAPGMRGLVAGAVAAGGLAVAARASRGAAVSPCGRPRPVEAALRSGS